MSLGKTSSACSHARVRTQREGVPNEKHFHSHHFLGKQICHEVDIPFNMNLNSTENTCLLDSAQYKDKHHESFPTLKTSIMVDVWFTKFFLISFFLGGYFLVFLITKIFSFTALKKNTKTKTFVFF